MRSEKDLVAGRVTASAELTTISIWNWCKQISRWMSSLVAAPTYLDRLVVHAQTVQGLEGLASAIRLPEGHVGDAAAEAVGSIGDLDALDVSYGVDKVLLCEGLVAG